MNDDPTQDDLRAKVFEDREVQGRWRVEKTEDDGGYEEVAVFDGAAARREAILYAECLYGTFDLIRLEPYR